MVDGPFIISPNIKFEVNVRILGGLMALGYTVATIMKRTSARAARRTPLRTSEASGQARGRRQRRAAGGGARACLRLHRITTTSPGAPLGAPLRGGLHRACVGGASALPRRSRRGIRAAYARAGHVHGRPGHGEAGPHRGRAPDAVLPGAGPRARGGGGGGAAAAPRGLLRAALLHRAGAHKPPAIHTHTLTPYSGLSKCGSGHTPAATARRGEQVAARLGAAESQNARAVALERMLRMTMTAAARSTVGTTVCHRLCARMR